MTYCPKNQLASYNNPSDILLDNKLTLTITKSPLNYILNRSTVLNLDLDKQLQEKFKAGR